MSLLSENFYNQKISFYCEHCDEPIYIGEEYIKTDNGNVHDNCYDEFSWNSIGATREVAEEVFDYDDE